MESRLAGLVHESARGDPGERSRHERFMVAHLTAGALALALIPPFLLWRGAPSPVEHLVLAAMAAPLLAAAILARSGRLALAQVIVSAGLAALVAGVAVASGDSGPMTGLALLVLPAEALLSGSRRGVIAASGLAVFAGFTIAAAGAGAAPASAWFLLPAFAVVAVGHATAALLASGHAEATSAPEIRAGEGRSGLQAVDDLVTWHDRNGHVVEASGAALTLLGMPPGALHGRGLFSRVHVPDRPAFLRAVSEAAYGERAVAQFRIHAGPGEGMVRGADGCEARPRVLWVEMRAHRIPNTASDAMPAVVAVTRDVSEHKRQLEELELACRQAERANLSKSGFLATVSHELRTPLNAIIGFSDLLAAESGTALAGDKRREYAAIIHDSGRHLLDIVDTLLDLSRIETGNFTFDPEPFDVADLVGGCCDLMSLRASGAGVALTRGVAPDLPELVAERRACRQILINLLSNALKFTPRGGTVRVEAARDRDRIVLTVSDSGVGVTEADLPRLGDPFFQAGQARDRSREGAGLGLSVVRGLVGLHRGSMMIESAPGEGTRVAVSLPIDCRTGASRPAAAVPVTTLSRPRGRPLAKVG